MKDSPERHKARNERLNKKRLSESERCQLEIDLGRSIPKHMLASALTRFLMEGPRKLKMPGVVDLTPISQLTIDYWTSQGYKLEDVQDDLQYQMEIKEANAENLKKGQRPYDPNKFEPKDPSHPYAYTPRYVTFAMRRNQGFCCFVMGWHESDWIRHKVSGEVRRVGKLTRDHTKAATNGGSTSHDNLKMVCAFANRRKGSKLITYKQLHDHLNEYWQLWQLTSEERAALEHFSSLGVRHITL